MKFGFKSIQSQNLHLNTKNSSQDVFSRIVATIPTKLVEKINNEHPIILKANWFDTLLGAVIAMSDEKSLYLLEFIDKPNLEHEVEKLKLKTKGFIIAGNTQPIELIKTELKSYFEGILTKFTTPLCFFGSPFQTRVWEELICIPYGQTRSYLEQAELIGKRTAYRAVANANGANQLAIVIPCHRVIRSNGNFGGYANGNVRKSWLIEHEKRDLQ